MQTDKGKWKGKEGKKNAKKHKIEERESSTEEDEHLFVLFL